MPVTLHTLTYDFSDLTGDDLIPGHTIAWVETNLGASEAIVDTSTGGQVMVGSKRMGDRETLNGTIDLPPTDSADTIPTDFQYRVWCEYQTVKAGKVVKGRWTSGWFSLTADANLKDVVEEFYAPPTYLTQLTTALDDHAAGLQETMDDTAAEVEADRLEVVALRAGITGDLGTTDSQAATLVNDDTTPSLTRTALNTAISQRTHVLSSDYAALADAVADTAAGGTLLVTEGTYALPVGGLILNQAIKLLFRGEVTLQQAHSGSPGIAISASDVVLDSEIPVALLGPQRTTYSENERGIQILGASAASPIGGIYIRGISPGTWGHAGVYAQHVNGAQLRNVVASQIQYAGFEFLSCLNVTGVDCEASDISPGSSGNCYGFANTRASTASLVTDPRSENIKLIRCKVSSISLWEGFDDHGSLGSQWIDCEADGVARALVAGVSTNGTTATWAAKDFHVRNFKANSGVTDGSRPIGISITGVGATGGTYGDLATGRVEGARLVGYGDVSSTIGAAIRLVNTFGVTLSNIETDQASKYGVLWDYNNFGGSLDGLAATDTWANSGVAAAVGVINGYNDVSIENVRGLRGSKSASVINLRGIQNSVATATTLLLGSRNDLRAFGTPVIAVEGVTRFDQRGILSGYVGASPVRGLWQPGSQALKTAPAASASPGWVCTTAGGASSATWAATTAYTAGTWIKTAAGKVMECIVAGTSGAVEPTLTTIGESVVDGTVTWAYRSTTSAVFKTMPALGA